MDGAAIGSLPKKACDGAMLGPERTMPFRDPIISPVHDRREAAIFTVSGAIGGTDAAHWSCRSRMWSQLAAGGAVSLLNFAIHAVVTALVVVATRHADKVTSESRMFVRLAVFLTVTMVALMIAHVVEIAVWAGYYRFNRLSLNNATYFEFAFENYTALGYGDALPVDGNRLIGPMTALNGLLLIGWSVAVIFEVMRMAELKFGGRR
jgi:hypothetical protein